MRRRFAFWLFATMSLLAPAALVAGAVWAQITLNALNDHGRKTMGRIVEKVPPSKDSAPRFVIEYVVDGTPYKVSESTDRPSYAAVPLGTEREVIYLPESPGRAETVDEVTREGGTSSTAVALCVVAAILSVISTPIWIWIELTQKKQRYLAREGLPLRATILEVAPYGSRKYDQWRIRYEFTLNGETQQGKAYVFGGTAAKLAGQNVPATVLYDPTNPACYDLYPAVTALYTITPSEFDALGK